MSEVEPREREPDPEESPFEAGPIEGMPFEKGSEEDLAIQRIIEKSGSDADRPA
jgi:hypothetical protein